MLKERSILFTTLDKAIDLSLTVCSFFAAYYISLLVSPYVFIEQFGSLDAYSWMLLVIIPAWIYALWEFDLYESHRMNSISYIGVQIGKVHLMGGAICTVAMFLGKEESFSRGFFIIFLLVSYSVLVAWKILVRYILWVLRERGYNYRQVLVIGDKDRVDGITAMIRNNKGWGLRTVGIINVERTQDALSGTLDGDSFKGDAKSLQRALSDHVVDEVLISTPYNIDTTEKIIGYCEELGLTVRILLDFFHPLLFKTSIARLDERYLLTLHAISLDTDKALIKRSLDIIVSVFGLLGVAVAFIPVAIMIRIVSPGPIIFSQLRVGQNGRLFKFHKFRTMRINAEEEKKELLGANEMNSVMFKIENDPRLIPGGKFLRKYSIDELPQLINVLRGEMSLVGPRPPVPEEVEQYSAWHRRRLSIKPGLTGLWQISGRSNIQDFDTVVRQDLEYIDKWSLWFDLKIIFKTIGVVIFQKGAK